MTFRDKLIELRQAAGMTQPALAAASGVPLFTLRNYEQSKTAERINFAYVVALAKALGVDCTAFADCELVAKGGAVPTPAPAEAPKRKPRGGGKSIG